MYIIFFSQSIVLLALVFDDISSFWEDQNKLGMTSTTQNS